MKKEKRKEKENLLALTKKSLPLSVKTLHFDVCILDTTEPSSINFSPSSFSVSLSETASVDASFANTGLALMPRINAAQG